MYDDWFMNGCFPTNLLANSEEIEIKEWGWLEGRCQVMMKNHRGEMVRCTNCTKRIFKAPGCRELVNSDNNTVRFFCGHRQQPNNIALQLQQANKNWRAFGPLKPTTELSHFAMCKYHKTHTDETLEISQNKLIEALRLFSTKIKEECGFYIGRNRNDKNFKHRRGKKYRNILRVALDMLDVKDKPINFTTNPHTGGKHGWSNGGHTLRDYFYPLTYEQKMYNSLRGGEGRYVTWYYLPPIKDFVCNNVLKLNAKIREIYEGTLHVLLLLQKRKEKQHGNNVFPDPAIKSVVAFLGYEWWKTFHDPEHLFDWTIELTLRGTDRNLWAQRVQGMTDRERQRVFDETLRSLKMRKARAIRRFEHRYHLKHKKLKLGNRPQNC